MTLVVFSCWIFVVWVSRQPGHAAVFQFLVSSALMMLAAGIVVWWYARHNETIPWRWILTTAVLLRLISIAGVPLFEDDYYRYLWDGYQTVASYDPYSLAPAAYFDREDYPQIFDSVLSFINYPEVATVYGPVAQWIFALGYLVAPAQVWPLQLLAALADITVLWLLYRLGAGRALLWYAWSPLLLKEFSLTAHPDIYAMLAVVLCIYLVSRQRIRLAGMVLALGVGAKVFAVLALPFLLSQRWSVSYWGGLCMGFALTIAAITLTFGTLAIWAPEGLQAMADSWMYNAAVYLWLLQWLEFQSIKVLLLCLFCTVTAVVCLRRMLVVRQQQGAVSAAEVRHQTIWRGDWLFLTFLLCLPVVNAWYVAWLLPFATIHPRWWSWAASYFCLLSYCTGSNLGRSGPDSLELPVQVITLEYLSVLVVVLLAWVATRNSRYRTYASW